MRLPNIREVVDYFRSVRDTVVCVEGNAFNTYEQIHAALFRCSESVRALFLEGVRNAEAHFHEPERDPYEAIREGESRYVQAALTALAYVGYAKALEAQALKNVIAFAGYSFGNYPLLMLGMDAPFVLAVEGGYARGRAQLKSCELAGFPGPYEHLCTLPNDEALEKHIATLESLYPKEFGPAIDAPRVRAFNMRRHASEYTAEGMPPLTPKPGHLPYHHPDAMQYAPTLFLAWFFERACENGKLALPAHIPLWIGRPGRAIMCAGTLLEQVQLVAEDMAVRVSWSAIAELLHERRVVVLTLGEDMKRSQLQVATTTVMKGAKAPGTWQHFAV